jgi:hypothetical protein
MAEGEIMNEQLYRKIELKYGETSWEPVTDNELQKRIEELEFEEKISLGLLTDNKITIATHKREIERLTSGLSESKAKVEELEKNNNFLKDVSRKMADALQESKAKEVKWVTHADSSNNEYVERSHDGLKVVWRGFECELPLPSPQPRTLDQEAQAAWEKYADNIPTAQNVFLRADFIAGFKAGREK